MNEHQDGASAEGQLPVDQLEQELRAKELLLEALRFENNSLKEYSERHYDPASAPDWKGYDALKRKVVEYQKALEQRDLIIGQLEAGIKHLMHKNVESETKGRKAEEHYSGEIQSLAQQVQELTAQLTLTTHQHQAALRATQDHYTQQLAVSEQQMREHYESEIARLKKQHDLEAAAVTLQLEALEKSKKEERDKLKERHTHLRNSLAAQLEEEKKEVLSLQREKEEWEVHKKELEAESEERKNLRRSLDEQIAGRDDLQERLQKQTKRQAEEEVKMESLRKAVEGLSQDLKVEVERREGVEGKLEKEMQNARKLFEEKTASEVKREQLALQLLVAEEELAKSTACRESDLGKLESLEQEKEALTQENVALSREKELLTRDKAALASEKDLWEKEKGALSLGKQVLAKEKGDIASRNEVLTKQIETLTAHCEALTKDKEASASKYNILTKEKEEIALERKELLTDKQLKDKEKENLVEKLEALTKHKESWIIETDVLLKEKEAYAMERDLWTRERETLILETEAWATEKEDLLTERESLFLEKKHLITDKEVLVRESEALRKRVEVLASEKEMTMKEKEKLAACIETSVGEKEMFLKEKDGLLSEKNSWAREKAALLQETDAWATEKEALLSEKETLLSQRKTLMAEKESWDKEKQNLLRQNDILCREKVVLTQKEELLNEHNQSLTLEKEVLAKENNKCASEKLRLIQQNECLSGENEMFTEEKDNLMKQLECLAKEKEDLTKKTVDFAAERETLTSQVNALQREKEALVYSGNKTRREALEIEVTSLKEELEVKRAEREQLGERCAVLEAERKELQSEREQLEERCAVLEAERKELQARYCQTKALKESDWRETEKSYKEMLSSKELEFRELEETLKTLKEELSLKEEELGKLEDAYRKKFSETEYQLKELQERVTIKENEVQELKKRDRGVEELHESCISVLGHLQCGEEERKKVEKECEDKCAMLNSVLRSIDVKLCEAASLVTEQRTGTESEMQGPESRRSQLEKALIEACREKEILTSKLRESEAAHSSFKIEKEEREKLLEQLHRVKGELEVRHKNEGDLQEKSILLEKEKKELSNEVERMNNKIHDQHFIITSLQNEKLRLGQHITQLEGERTAQKESESLRFKDNLNLQEELSHLKVKVTAQEQQLELQEEEMGRLHQALTALTQPDAGCPEELRATVMSLACSSSKHERYPLWLSVLCQELETQWKHQQASLGRLIDLQELTDKLQEEKLQTDLENISLRAELDFVKQSKNQDELGVDEGLGRTAEEAEFEKLKQENKMFRKHLDSNSLLLRLEKLKLLGPQPKFERESDLCLRERKAVVQVVTAWLQRFVSHWKLQAESHPSVLEFAEALTTYTERLSEHLLSIGSGDSLKSIDDALNTLQQAVIKAVSGEYQGAVSGTLEALDQELSHISLHHISLPPSLLDTTHTLSLPLQETSPQSTSHHQHPDSSTFKEDLDSQNFLQDVTAKVEQLINVRTALVDAANEFDEELEEVLGQRVALLRQQLQGLLQVKAPSPGQGHQGGSGSALPPATTPPPPRHQTYIQKFSDFVSRVSQEAHAEKLQVLRNQQEMVHKILEDNQAKLSEVCYGFMESLQGVASVQEVEVKTQALVNRLEKTLADETAWVEQQYKDLLEQYMQEQDLKNQALATTCSNLVCTLTHLLHSTEVENEPREPSQETSPEVEQLREEHQEVIQRLEAQLAAKDHESLQHLQGLYNDRDWYKKTVGLLSHVTLQLLHFYSVAQSLTHESRHDSSPPPHPSESPTPGRVLDLSFLSDCVGEEEELLVFSDDGVLVTGLVGQTAVGGEGEAENAEPVLDITAVSEGLMDDIDKDEQVRTLLERAYPQMMAILKGCWDRVQVTRLEKEVQELTISLQAAAGMLRIFIHSVSGDKNDLSSHTIKDEVHEESVRDSAFETSHSQLSQENNAQKEVLHLSSDPFGAVQQTTDAKASVLPSGSILQQDLSTISEALIQLLSQEENLSSFTMLVSQDPQNKEQLKAVLRQLCEAAQASASLKLDLHQAQSLQQGLEEDRLSLQEEITRLTHYSKNLARKLQVLKDQLEEKETQENQKPVSQYAAKMEATKGIREKVCAALSAKNAAQLERGELEARVRELEALLEAVIRESDAAQETLRSKVTDLSQQLEVADRQLKSARQFFEEHASERDQEVEELVAARDKLSIQLREREAQMAVQETQEKEVESLEQQLQEKCEELQQALCSKEELQVEHRAAKDKIWDLREIIQSLESQVDTRCVREAELTEQMEILKAALTHAQQELSYKVEETRLGGKRLATGQETEEMAPSTSGREEGAAAAAGRGDACCHTTSLLHEMQENTLSASALFQVIEKRLGDTTRGLEAMQLSGSVEDISAQEVEVTVAGAEGRLSPATVDRRLEDQLMALERTTEAAIKRSKDLQLTIKNLQVDYEEVSAERDTLQERSREQLVKISGLEARLDEVRRADHPTAADMRQRVALLQEDLEEKRAKLTKKCREIEELKHTLSSLRTQLTSRERELERLQSAPLTQPNSPLQTSQEHPRTEENLASKTHSTNIQKEEPAEVSEPAFLPPSLVQDLISEKNAEISELAHKLRNLVCTIQKVCVLLQEKGSPSKVHQMLFRALGLQSSEALNESEEQEVLRRAELDQMPSPKRDGSVKETAGMVESPVVLLQDSGGGPRDGSVHTQPSSATDLSLMSTHTVSPPELSQVSQLTEDLQQASKPLLTTSTVTPSRPPQAQARLEEDFASAQELLEAREAEILQLTEEAEDSPLMPLPRSSSHCPAVDLKVEEQLRQALHEATVSKADCEAQLQQVTLKNKMYGEEIKQLQGSLEMLRQEAQQASVHLKEKEAKVQALRQQLQDGSQQHKQQKEELNSSLKASQEQVEQLYSSLQRKSEEVKQLSAQLEQMHAHMKERLSQASGKASHMEEQFRQEITDLKEQHVAREKELCSHYEECMAKQVAELAECMNRNKEAAMARQQEVFEATLREATQERDQTEKQMEEGHTTSPPPLPQMPDQQTAAQLCASVDALSAAFRQELEKSGQLDLSLASLVRGGGGGNGEVSTRASSALSDASEGEEPTSITGRIQHLMNKVHNDGIEVLTLMDIQFLCKHHTHFDNNQRSLTTTTNALTASSPPPERGGVGAEQAHLLRSLATVEEELRKKEQEMKRKIRALEIQLEQEKMSGSEWKLSFESEKQHARDLMEQLRQERLTGAEQVSELSLLRSQLLILRLQQQKVQEENCTLSDCQEKKDKQIENLQSALQAERNNFIQVSKVLSEERKVSGLKNSQQEAIIKDLHSSLEMERERIKALCNHLERVTIHQPTQLPTTTATTTTRHQSSLRKPDDSSKPAIENLQVQLAVERERCRELERACERERLRAVSQKEQGTAERALARVEAREAEGRLAELTRTVRSLETEKERLIRQMSHEKELLQHQDSCIKELEGKVRMLEADSRAQSEAHQAMAQKMREEGTQLHLAYTRTLTKLGEVEAEVCELRHKVRRAASELQLAKEQEEQLKQDLHTERMAVDRLGLPALSRVTNFDGYAEMQVKENLELYKSVLRLTDDQRATRARIAELQDTITSLSQQLLQARASSSNLEEVLKRERLVWERERERTTLQHLSHQQHEGEAEAERLTAERNTRQNTTAAAAAAMQQLYGRYLQSEHWRKALVWQKKYLLVVIKGYSDTEQHTLTRLTAMAPPPLHLIPSVTVHHQAQQQQQQQQQRCRRKFRVGALVVVATCRMRSLVQRFQRKKLHWVSVAASGTPESRWPWSGSSSSSSVVGARGACPATPLRAVDAAGATSFTGLTPPTRGPTNTPPASQPHLSSHRSLFQEDSGQLNQYVERLDNIHSVLGLTHRKQ